MFIETMKGMFQKISVQLTKPLSLKKKRQSLLNDIGGEWYMKNEREASTPKETKIKQKAQEKEVEIKINLQMVNRSWNNWKF